MRPTVGGQSRSGRIDTWSEVRDVRNGVVTYENHYVFAATRGACWCPKAGCVSASHAELTQSLADAGFAVERVYGDWDGQDHEGPRRHRELIVIAQHH